MYRRIFLLSGLAILGVVLNHAAGWGQIAMFQWAHRYRAVTSPNFDLVGSLPYYILLVVRQLTLASVPAFLFVSGFFVAYAARGSQSTPTWKSIWSRISKLLVPYLIWSVLVFGGNAILRQTYSPFQYALKLFTTGADGPYYYVPLLCYLYLLAPLMVPLARNHWRLLLGLTGAIQLGAMSLRYLWLFKVPVPGLDILIRLTPDWLLIRWLFYFAVAIVAGLHLDQFQCWLAKIQRPLLALTVLLALLAILEPELIYRIAGFDQRAVPLTLAPSLYSMAIILCFLAYSQITIPFSGVLSQLGGKSYGIYLIHFEAMAVFAKAVYHFAAWLLAYPILYQVPLMVLGLGIPLVMMETVIRSPARRYYHALFG